MLVYQRVSVLHKIIPKRTGLRSLPISSQLPTASQPASLVPRGHPGSLMSQWLGLSLLPSQPPAVEQVRWFQWSSSVILEHQWVWGKINRKCWVWDGVTWLNYFQPGRLGVLVFPVQFFDSIQPGNADKRRWWLQRNRRNLGHLLAFIQFTYWSTITWLDGKWVSLWRSIKGINSHQ